jgi:hypothetical protein
MVRIKNNQTLLYMMPPEGATMIFVIGQLEFEGPFTNQADLRPNAGIYAILSQQGDDFELLDLCDTERVDHCLDKDEYTSNLLFFEENCNGKLTVVVHYTGDMPAANRRQLRNELMAELNEQFLDEAC